MPAPPGSGLRWPVSVPVRRADGPASPGGGTWQRNTWVWPTPGLRWQHKPDSGLGRPPRKATTRRMAKSVYAGYRVSPMARPKRNGGAPDQDCAPPPRATGRRRVARCGYLRAFRVFRSAPCQSSIFRSAVTSSMLWCRAVATMMRSAGSCSSQTNSKARNRMALSATRFRHALCQQPIPPLGDGEAVGEQHPAALHLIACIPDGK